MEEPSSLDPHHPPPIYHHHLQLDSEQLAIPLLDDADAILNGELSFPDDCVGNDFHIDDYLDFSLEDLNFAEGVLLDPGSDANSGSSDEPGYDQNHSISHPRVSDSLTNRSHVLEGLDHGFSAQGFGGVEASNSKVNLETSAPRVSDESILAQGNNSDHDSSVHVPCPETENPGLNRSICSNGRPVGSEVNQKLNHSSPPESVSCEHLSSQGSGASNSGFSHGDNPRTPDSCQSARDVSSSYFNDVSKNDQKYSNKSTNCEVKVEDAACKFVPKRKKDQEDDGHSDSRTSKSRKSSLHVEDANSNGTFNAGLDDEEKKKARLMRNRESAQLSRQRKKQYVEELEDKVRSMHSTITDLNSKISYIMAENAALRQQMSGGGVCPPPHPGMYPMPPMGYPWMPCPPYVVKPQGSQVPLVPIPRLKPQQPATAPKVSRKSDKVESKKGEGKTKTKKVASISFLGLLFFFLLFGALVPMISVRYGRGIGESFSFSSRFSDTHKGRILMVDGGLNRSGHERGRIYTDGNNNHKNGVLNVKNSRRSSLQKDHLSKSSEASNDGSGNGANSSEPLVASLYVPRNDKLVQIDGNLIIHSVLASERASTSSDGKGQEKQGKDTSLAIARNYVPAYHVSGRQRALGSGIGDSSKLPANDGRLQQWFQEGLAGPLLSSGMCTEVFQFNVSPTPGSIIPATSVPNKTASEARQNSTRGRNKSSRNRRILHGHPITLNNAHALNLTEQHHNMEPSTENVRGLHGNKSAPSMIVSVLMDPREAGDGDGETVMRSKSHSRIFVVVLIDSIKYVTYSCMLPLMGSGHHLVTA